MRLLISSKLHLVRQPSCLLLLVLSEAASLKDPLLTT
jgi:hypothetical protein